MKDNEIRNERLAPLSSLKDYKVAKDNTDVLGWRVVGADGESLGMVKDLMVDMKAMKARYLSVVADNRFFNTSIDQYLLIPIGAAALDKKGKKVFVSAIDSKSISRYPVYPGGPIPEDYEYAVRDNFLQSQRDSLDTNSGNYNDDFDDSVSRQPVKSEPDTFYDNDTYNEERFYTSDTDVHRDREYHNKDYDTDDTSTDFQNESKKPKNVEDSIATIERLEQLRERGSITEEEFILLKKRALDL
ncbi:PRC-barrel domain-containing protein [Pontibacter locisalis]|uniref:PRC-barrel domain-containing protein n=1 Tax=Pontibacter locisalis TaxID=1719035 RepID=A0ABW5INF9_9BACT